jgi:hypothetical protein
MTTNKRMTADGHSEWRMADGQPKELMAYSWEIAKER